MRLQDLWADRGAIIIIVGVCFAVVLLIQWVAWLFKWGRFGSPPVQAATAPTQPLRFLIANFFAEIINDFRHLLALIIISVFAIALFVGMYPGLVTNNVETIADGVQAVAAALGGLIGSIIGYYFGESAATRNPPGGGRAAPTGGSPVQRPPSAEGDAAPIVAAPLPPSE